MRWATHGHDVWYAESPERRSVTDFSLPVASAGIRPCHVRPEAQSVLDMAHEAVVGVTHNVSCRDTQPLTIRISRSVVEALGKVGIPPLLSHVRRREAHRCSARRAGGRTRTVDVLRSLAHHV